MKTNKWSTMRFYEEEGGGASPTEPSRGSSIFEPIAEPIAVEPVVPVVETPPGEVTPEPPKVPTEFDASALAKEFGTVLREHLPKAPEVKDEPMTPEAAAKLLNVWEPTPEWIEKFDNLETRQVAIKEMRDGQIKQADTLTQVRVNQAIESMRAEFAPAVAYMTEQAAVKREEKFNTTFPQLAKTELRPLLSAITSDFQAKGRTFQTEDELFSEIAKGAEAVMQQVDPNFKLSTGSTPVVKPKPTSKASPNAIPVTSGGASGGGGGGGQQAPVKPRGLAVFD